MKVLAKNKKIHFQYLIIDTFVSGIVLKGSEMKPVRSAKINLSDAYCFFKEHELWVKNCHISEYSKATIFSHEPKRERKLLLHKKELTRLKKGLEQKGNTLVPLSVFLNERGKVKTEIALCKGKKIHDKRETMKKRDSEKSIARTLKTKKIADD